MKYLLIETSWQANIDLLINQNEYKQVRLTMEEK